MQIMAELIVKAIHKQKRMRSRALSKILTCQKFIIYPLHFTSLKYCIALENPSMTDISSLRCS